MRGITDMESRYRIKNQFLVGDFVENVQFSTDIPPSMKIHVHQNLTSQKCQLR